MRCSILQRFGHRWDDERNMSPMLRIFHRAIVEEVAFVVWVLLSLFNAHGLPPMDCMSEFLLFHFSREEPGGGSFPPKNG